MSVTRFEAGSIPSIKNTITNYDGMQDYNICPVGAADNLIVRVWCKNGDVIDFMATSPSEADYLADAFMSTLGI